MKRHHSTNQFAWLYPVGLLLLTACGGGGGGLNIRTNTLPPVAPPPPVTPPPPPGALSESCPAPITGDCIVEPPYALTWPEIQMTGGRQSDFRLVVAESGGWLNLMAGEYRFSGGTQIAGASLVVWDTLVSDVEVLHQGPAGSPGSSVLWLGGTVRGNVSNDDKVSLRHFCGTGLNLCMEDRHPRIEGNYVQGATGELEAVLGWELQVTGTAALDGRLTLIPGTSASYVLPTAPASVLVLHAGAGIAGKFANWGTSGLFLSGNLRYTGQDVYFDATRISLAAAMASAGVSSPIALGSAARLDHAFGQADRYATAPRNSLTATQQQFLASAASVQHIRDLQQANRSLESLAGHGHAMATTVLEDQTRLVAAQLSARLDALPAGIQATGWSEPLLLAHRWAGRHSLDGEAAGADRWIDSHWLVGTAIANGSTTLQFDHMGGFGIGRASLAGVYAHYRNDRAHATVLTGSSRALLDTTRLIDLGDAGEHQVFARRTASQLFVHGEVGRDVGFGSGQWTPYVAVDYAVLRSDGFVEQGATGFEVAAWPARIGELSMAVGGRYAQQWALRGGRLELALDARHQRLLATHGDALQAAFTGAPDASFDLSSWPAARYAGTLGVGLVGELDTGWTWTVDYHGALGNTDPAATWSLALRRPF